MNKIVKIFMSLFLVFALILAGGYYYYRNNLAPVNSSQEVNKVEFLVEKGTTPGVIAKKLKENNLIKDEKSFLAFVRLNKLDSQLKAGNYLLTDAMSVKEITDVIIKGVSIQKRFTVPEGFTIWQIAELMEKENIMTQDEFWDLAIEEDFPQFDFLKGLKKDKHRMEGYLFPETYYISETENPKKIFEIMLTQYQTVRDRLPENKSGLNEREALILASLVEAESMAPKERPVIASVFLNRLALNMRLECDATIQYALGKRKEIVLYSDLEIDSPYNTYRRAGLTPTPICATGESALRAVYQPEDTDYLFFFAKNDGTGEHIFNQTYAEHEREMRDWGYRQ